MPTYHGVEVKSSADRVPQFGLPAAGQAPFLRAHRDCGASAKSEKIEIKNTYHHVLYCILIIDRKPTQLSNAHTRVRDTYI